MIDSLATVQDVADRVGEEITDPGDIRLAEVLLRIVSAQVRHYGGDWMDPILAPDVATAITIEAAARGYLNPEGFKLERGDEITFDRHAIFAAGPTLTPYEIVAVRQQAGKSGLTSVLMVRDVTVTDALAEATDD